MLTRRAFGASTATLAVADPIQAAPTKRALVVGVSEYPALPSERQLKGPRNDVERLTGLLVERGFDAGNVVVLADGVTGSSALPTRAEIMKALQRLEQSTAKGDFVLIYFAGHGSQQPVPAGAPDGEVEADGLQEVFLPRDVKRLDATAQVPRIENGLTKPELAGVVDRLRARGAFVWVIVDTCHAATLVRGSLDDDVVFRQVTPAELGITEQHLAAARSRAAQRAAAAGPRRHSAQTTDRHDGSSVFFYACQTTEQAGEYSLPPSVKLAQTRRYGAFSYMLMQALESRIPMTYRQLAQHVLSQFGAIQINLQTPVFAGDALDEPVLLLSSAPPARWPISVAADQLWVQAGALNGLASGAVLAVVPGALASASDVKGYAKVVELGPTSAQIVPVSHDGRQPPADARALSGQFAMQVRPGVPYGLTVSLSFGASIRDNRGSPARHAIDRLRTSGVPGAAITWVDAPTLGDISLSVGSDRATVFPRGRSAQAGHGIRRGEASEVRWTEPGRVVTPEGVAARLSAELHKVARATNLLRLAGAMAGHGSLLDAGLRVGMEVKANRRSAVARPIRAGEVPVLTGNTSGDRGKADDVVCRMHNVGNVPLDVTVLYIDSRFGIHVLYPDPPEGSARLMPGDRPPAVDITIHDDTTGIERIVFIAIKPRRLDVSNSLAFLAQASLSARRQSSASGEVEAFEDAAFADFTSRTTQREPKVPGTNTTMEVFTVEVRGS